MESCQEEFSARGANGKPRDLIRDFVTPSRPCFKPSSSRTVFTISRTVDQIKVKPCNSFAELRPSQPLSVFLYPFIITPRSPSVSEHGRVEYKGLNRLEDCVIKRVR